MGNVESFISSPWSPYLTIPIWSSLSSKAAYISKMPVSECLQEQEAKFEWIYERAKRLKIEKLKEIGSACTDCFRTYAL